MPYAGRGIDFPVKYLPLSIMPTGCGFQKESSEDYSWHGLYRGSREFCLWQYTTGGRGALLYEGKEHTLLPGDAMMLHVPHEHRYFFPADSQQWEFIYVSFNGREIMRIWREFEQRHGPVADFREDSKTVDSALGIIMKSFENNWSSSFEASAMSYSFLMNLLEELPSRSETSPPEWIEQVIDFCRKNYHRNIGIQDMADAVSYSRFHFSREFARIQGTTPAAFLKSLRLKNAVRLIQTERLNIKEVAHRCGFRDSSYFCKVFRKEFATSPERFRKGE